MGMYREVLCPLCRKKYMTHLFEEYDIIVDHNGQTLNGWMDICPKCSSKLFVIDHVLEATTTFDKHPENFIIRKFILR